MQTKKIKLLAVVITGFCVVSACSGTGTVNTSAGSVTASGSITLLKFAGSFTADVEPVPSPSPTVMPTAVPSGQPTPMPTATPTPVPPSNATGNVNVEIKENTTNITNNTTIININYVNISSEVTQTIIEAEDGSSPTVINLPNGQLNNYNVTLNAEQVNLIKSGKAVVKVKTKNHPRGEIKCKLNKQ
jgi:hypothetical protein